MAFRGDLTVASGEIFGQILVPFPSTESQNYQA